MSRGRAAPLELRPATSTNRDPLAVQCPYGDARRTHARPLAAGLIRAVPEYGSSSDAHSGPQLACGPNWDALGNRLCAVVEDVDVDEHWKVATMIPVAAREAVPYFEALYA